MFMEMKTQVVVFWVLTPCSDVWIATLLKVVTPPSSG
jgi:hypothetical protein